MDLLVKNYSQAFYDFANQKKSLSQAVIDMTHLKSLIDETKSFYHFLKSPFISELEIKDIVSFLKKKIKLSSVTVQFINFLYFQKRLNYLQKICESFAFIHEKTLQQTIVYTISAHELSPDYKITLTDLLQKKLKNTIVLKEKIVPSLMGGIILKINDYKLDFSFKGHLTQLAKQIKG